ncbi:MAG: calcium/sodium antiporter [Deltaproteobacteria bacterium]|nr:calcium/sodium antiporter [Deltaproteobacteria bacterium]
MEIIRWVGNETALHNAIAGFPAIILLLLIVICLIILAKGADWMIDGVVYLAKRTGLSRIVIGATIISLGTTTPEAFVSVMAAWMGNSGLALGNGVGSIIADTGLIFGLTCLLGSVPINRYILNRTGWVQVGAAVLLVVISVIAWIIAPEKPVLNRLIGVFFLILLTGYLYATYTWSQQSGELICADETEMTERKAMTLAQCWLMVIGGLILVVSSARVLVPCAAEIASRIGVPDDIIAATLVALGTSLPELITAVTAIRKECTDIVVGNIVGADVLNCLFVIGAAAVAKPLTITQNFFTFHFPAMLIILFSFRIFIFMNRDNRFRRWQGLWLLSIYVIYIALQYSLKLGTSFG